jgi:hypothetical protein
MLAGDFCSIIGAPKPLLIVLPMNTRSIVPGGESVVKTPKNGTPGRKIFAGKQHLYPKPSVTTVSTVRGSSSVELVLDRAWRQSIARNQTRLKVPRIHL